MKDKDGYLEFRIIANPEESASIQEHQEESDIVRNIVRALS